MHCFFVVNFRLFAKNGKTKQYQEKWSKVVLNCRYHKISNSSSTILYNYCIQRQELEGK